MIDHVSIGVRDLAASRAFYEAVLAPLGLAAMLEREGTVGFGKRYPEFWLNARPGRAPVDEACGTHVSLRAPDREAVHAFHETAIAAGGRDGGGPGPRPQYSQVYYAAFVRDLDGHLVEAVTFLPGGA